MKRIYCHSQNNREKLRRVKCLFTWRSMEEDCNVYTLVLLHTCLIRHVTVSIHIIGDLYPQGKVFKTSRLLQIFLLPLPMFPFLNS